MVGVVVVVVIVVSSESIVECILIREIDRFWFKNGYLVENKVFM